MIKPAELGSTVLTSQRKYQAEHDGESPSNVRRPRGQGVQIRKPGRTDRRSNKQERGKRA